MTRVLGDWVANILHFWFDEIPREAWFGKEEAFDQRLRERFLAHHEHIAVLPVADCVRAAETAMASVIALDQFPRNMFRGHARTYEADAIARAVAGRAIARGFDAQVPHDERQFFYLPFMHSEDLADQERCVDLGRRYRDDEFLKYAEQHADIIRRFGRCPHRNAMLGRATTPQEQAFLNAGGFAG